MIMRNVLGIALSLCLILQGLSAPISKHTVSGAKATDDEVKNLEDELRKQAGEGKKDMPNTELMEENDSPPIDPNQPLTSHTDKRTPPKHAETIDDILKDLKDRPSLLHSLVEELKSTLKSEDKEEDGDSSSEEEKLVKGKSDDKGSQADANIFGKNEESNKENDNISKTEPEHIMQSSGKIHNHKYELEDSDSKDDKQQDIKENGKSFRYRLSDYEDDDGEITPGKGYLSRLWQKRWQKRQAANHSNM